MEDPEIKVIDMNVSKPEEIKKKLALFGMCGNIERVIVPTRSQHVEGILSLFNAISDGTKLTITKFKFTKGYHGHEVLLRFIQNATCNGYDVEKLRNRLNISFETFQKSINIPTAGSDGNRGIGEVHLFDL